MPATQVNGLTLLRVSGSSFEMGLEHGRCLKDTIGTVIESYLYRSEEIFKVPFAFLREQASSCEPHIPEDYCAELRGVAEGSGIDYSDLVALNCLVDIDAYFSRHLLFCCNFVVGPPATTDGLVMHGRNTDFPPAGILPGIATVMARVPSSPGVRATVSASWPGFVGILTGCNDVAISAAPVACPSKESTLAGVPLMFMIRKALESSDSANGMAGNFSSMSRTGGYNIAVCGGGNEAMDAAAVELTPSLCEMRTPSNGVLVVDSVALCSRTARNRLTTASGAFRHARAMWLIQEHCGKIDVPTALRILKDNYDLGLGIAEGDSYSCICNHDTIHSILYVPRERRILLAQGTIPAPRGQYVELFLDDLFATEGPKRHSRVEKLPEATC